MADYRHVYNYFNHLHDQAQAAATEPVAHVLTVVLSDGTMRHYPGDYEARPLEGEWLAIYRPTQSTMPGFAIPVAGFRRNRVESFSYSGHEVYPVADHDDGELVGTVHDPLSLLDDR